MAGELLDVAQRSARARQQPGRAGDERPAAGVRGAAGKAELGVGGAEPVDDAARAHRAAALRSDHGATARSRLRHVQPNQRDLELGMHRHAPRRAVLGDLACNRDMPVKPAIGPEDHRPLKPGDLAGSEACLEAQQHHGVTTSGVAMVANVPYQTAHVGSLQHPRGLGHLLSPVV